MTRSRWPLVLGFLFCILVALAGGAWWYLFGANKAEAAELVPGDALAFAVIPNGAPLLVGYRNSQLKTLIESDNAQPLIGFIMNFVGTKNADLIAAFAPNLSGQSFVAVTKLDPAHPEHIGLIAAMKPKAGLGDFDGFVAKLKETWPDRMKEATTGDGQVAGFSYQWIRGPGGADKICVARIGGWIVTTWGEAPLQDWIERYEKTSTTPSLAQNADYQKALAQVGKDAMTVLYLNAPLCADLLQKHVAQTNPASAAYLSKKEAGLTGGLALGSRFENGEIVDRFFVPVSSEARSTSGFGAMPCPFDTLKYTGPDTRFYWGASIDWKQMVKNLDDASTGSSPAPTTGAALLEAARTWATDNHLDFQHNVLDPLGSEISIQAEWSSDATYPEAGFFATLDKPDDFKPTIQAIIASVSQAYSSTAVAHELDSSGQKFAALKFLQGSPIAPTITEDGPCLGIFLSENQAVRSFLRDTKFGLPHNDDFNRQIGDRSKTASQIVFLDSPQLLDRAYRTALPYLSLVSMFSKDVAALLKDKTLPDDLTWVAPMGTWSCVVTPDDAGLEVYSTSGIGNQGIYFGSAMYLGAPFLQSMGWLPKLSLPVKAEPTLPAPAPAIPPVNPPAATPTTTPTTQAATNAAPVAPPDPAPPVNPGTNPTNAPPATPDAPK